MITPKALQAGDKVAIIATARRTKKEDIEPSLKIFKEWNLEVLLSPHLFSEDHSYLAGTDEQRMAGLQQYLDDDSVSAIFCARGGYGTTRIIETVDFREFQKKPKWVIGFSDITSLQLKLFSLGIKSIHGIMPALFLKSDANDSVESLKKILFDQPVELLATASSGNKPGTAQGILVGGNLSLLVDSLGTAYEPETKGKVLLLEEVDEYLYRIDRMMVQLKRANKLDSLAGLAIGHFSDIKDTELPFGETVEEIIRFHTRDFSYPVGFGFPTGHINPNLSWIQGATARLDVGEVGSALKTLIE